MTLATAAAIAAALATTDEDETGCTANASMIEADTHIASRMVKRDWSSGAFTKGIGWGWVDDSATARDVTTCFAASRAAFSASCVPIPFESRE